VISGIFLPMGKQSLPQAPMIKVSISDLQQNIIMDDATAILDTGSESCAIDTRIIKVHPGSSGG
jgi:hypothetical protein